MITTLSNAQEADSIQTIAELKVAIEKILDDTNTPAVGIAMVDTSGSIWTVGLGTADKESGRKADEITMLRIGSTSKMFASLCILKLQEEGKVNLKDKVKDLVPEIEFTNPWAETNPILVEHLLEHTTGWDDIHLPEPVSLDSAAPPASTHASTCSFLNFQRRPTRWAGILCFSIHL